MKTPCFVLSPSPVVAVLTSAPDRVARQAIHEKALIARIAHFGCRPWFWILMGLLLLVNTLPLPAAGPPDPPTNVRASDGVYYDRIRVTWTQANAIVYYICRNTTSQFQGATNVGVSVTLQFEDINNIVPGTVYYYWVLAMNPNLTPSLSLPSTPNSGFALALQPPTGVSASDGAFIDKVSVSWNPVIGATGYEVWRNTTNSTKGAREVAARTASPFDDFSVTPDRTYWYWVKATNQFGASGFSANDFGYIGPNTPPQFRLGMSVVSVIGLGGPVTVPNLAIDIKPYSGPGSVQSRTEADQRVHFVIANISQGPAQDVFLEPPAVSPEGTLTFRTHLGANIVADVTLVLMDDGGTANGGADCSAAQEFQIEVVGMIHLSTNVIPAGAGSITIDPPSFGAGIYEPSGVMTLTANPANGYAFSHWSGALSGTISPTNIYILTTTTVTAHFAPVGQPGTLQCVQSSWSVNENGTAATITVTRAGGSAGVVSVNYATSNGTAAAGSDYTATSGTLSWADGDMSPKTFSVPILNDTVSEGTETIDLTLSNPTGGASLGSPSTATLSILDDDQAVSRWTLTLSSSGGGTVTANPLPDVSDGKYAAGTVVALTATPKAGYQFSSWTGASGSSATTVMLDGNKTVTAIFTLRAGYLVGLRRQIYTNIAGSTIADLISSPKFPGMPDILDSVPTLESQYLPNDAGENYGQRLTGWLVPPQTGNYIFYLASDDAAQVFLSTDESAAKKPLIVEETGWSPPRNWEETAQNPQRASASIALVAGQYYYLEVLHKEGGGGDNLAVAWKLPNGTAPLNGSPPIGTEYLSYRSDMSDVPILTTACAQPVGSGSERGFSVRLVQTAGSGEWPNTLLRAEEQLAGVYLDNGVLAVPDILAYETPDLINYSETTVDGVVSSFGNFSSDRRFPGLGNGYSAATRNVAMEMVAYLKLDPGTYRFGVNSDDGFRLTTGATPQDTNLVLGFFEGARGASDTLFEFRVTVSGLYPFRLIWEQGGGGHNVEWFSVASDGTKTLINGTNALGQVPVPAYRYCATLANPVTIVQPPVNQTVTVGQSATFTVGARYQGAINPAALVYQWKSKGSEIVGAQRSTLVLPLVTADDTGKQFACVVGLLGYPWLTSSSATLTVTGLPQRYALTMSSSPAAGGSVTANPLPGTDGHYASSTVVTLTAKPNAGYTFSGWSGATRGSGNPTTITMNGNKTVTANFTIQGTVSYQPGLLRQIYTNIPGNSIADLMGSSKYPNAPDITDAVPTLESQWLSSDAGENYGQRLTGWLVPPQTGNYVFYLASDDAGQVYLSTDEGAANKRLIVEETSWTTSRNWEGIPGLPQRASTPISLVAGNHYYLEVLHKQGAGRHNLAVAWKLPNGTAPQNGDPPIGGEYLVYQPGQVPGLFFPLRTSALPLGSGSVSVSPSPSSNGRYPAGTVVTVMAQPISGYQFADWEGALSGTANPTTLTLNNNLTVTARFASQLPLATLINPSFEMDTFTKIPGYVGDNGPITGWSANGAGVNPIWPFASTNYYFTDNGAIPEGRQAAFVQSDGPLSQVVKGLVAGGTYRVDYCENGRTHGDPGQEVQLEVRIGGTVIVPAHSVPPVGGSNPYWAKQSATFVATAAQMKLAFVKVGPASLDRTVLIDDVRVVCLKKPTPLFATLGSGGVTLAWDLTFKGVILETTTSLTPPVQWTAVPGVVNNQVTMPTAGPNRFYRLRLD
jgi:uncharacterized repeat protein (TIGR02543 family)